MVHVRPGRLPSTETGLALCTDRPRAEDPGRSARTELSGSCPAHSGQERDRLEFQLRLSLHDGSWPSVGPTGPSKDPESRGAMGWKLLLPSHQVRYTHVTLLTSKLALTTIVSSNLIIPCPRIITTRYHHGSYSTMVGIFLSEVTSRASAAHTR